MIGISQLYTGATSPADPLRYGRQPGRLPPHLLRFSEERKPVVVWNCSRRCNLRCIHCYADSRNQRYAATCWIWPPTRRPWASGP